MKTALLLAAILAFALPSSAQISARAPSGSSVPSSVRTNPPPPPRTNGGFVRAYGPRYYSSFDSSLSFGVSSSSSPTISRSGSGITVYGNPGPWEPSVPQVYSNWTLMLFAQSGMPQVSATGDTPSLGAIARSAREAKADAERPKVKIRQDENGKAILVQEQR